MGYNRLGVKFIGGKGKPANEGKVMIYTSSVDTLATILADSYFDTLANILDGNYLAIVKGTDGQLLINLTVSSGVVSHEAGVQNLAGAGAVNLTSLVTEVTSSSTDALTLANGTYVGQMKIVTLIVDGGTPTLTPATGSGYTTIAFADAGDTVTLVWTTLGWAIAGQGGLTTGPLSA